MGGLLLARAARAGGLTLRDLLHLLVAHLLLALGEQLLVVGGLGLGLGLPRLLEAQRVTLALQRVGSGLG